MKFWKKADKEGKEHKIKEDNGCWPCFKMKIMTKEQKKNKMREVKRHEEVEVVMVQTTGEIKNLYEKEEVKTPAEQVVEKQEEEVKAGEQDFIGKEVKTPVEEMFEKQEEDKNL